MRMDTRDVQELGSFRALCRRVAAVLLCWPCVYYHGENCNLDICLCA